MKLIPLGINGFHPSFGRQTTSFLLIIEDQAILFDAGTGLGRLAEPSIRRHVESVTTLNIMLSHYHLDHIVGLSYLPGVWRGRRVNILGPAPPFVESAPDVALNRLLAPPFFLPLDDFPLAVTVTPIAVESFSLGNIQVRVRPQKHPGGSIGIRIDDALAYMTDTVAEEGPLAFLRGVRLLIHEMWFLAAVEPELAEQVGHSEMPKVLDLTVRSGVPRLMPMHFDPSLESAALDVIATESASRPVDLVMPAEMACYEV